MNVCIFGANGRTGREVVSQAVHRGYTVTACVHSKPKNGVFPSSVLLKIGDVSDETYVADALSGADVVISVIRHGKHTPPHMQTDGTKNIIKAMDEHNLSRFISLSGSGIRVPGDNPSIIDRFANWSIARIDPLRIQDGIDHVAVLEASDLSWTVLRVLKLSNRSSRMPIHFTSHGPAELLSSRKRVAAALLESGELQRIYQTIAGAWLIFIF